MAMNSALKRWKNEKEGDFESLFLFYGRLRSKSSPTIAIAMIIAMPKPKVYVIRSAVVATPDCGDVVGSCVAVSPA